MEQFIIDLCANETGNHGLEILPFTDRSFNDVSFSALFLDAWKVLLGYSLMFAYTVCMLGRLNRTEVRFDFSGLPPTNPTPRPESC